MSRAKELLDAATPLPWRWVRDSGSLWLWGHNAETVGDVGMVLAPHVCSTCERSGNRCLGPSEADAALITGAVNRLPDYEAAVEALERLLEASRGSYQLIVPQPVIDARAALRRLRDEVTA